MTWDKKFEGIREFLHILERKGRNLVVIIDPHIKNDDYYELYTKALEKSIDYYSIQDSLSRIMTSAISLGSAGVRMQLILISII